MFKRFTVSNSSLSNPFATFLFCCHSLFSAFYISQFSFYLFIYKSTKVVKMHVTYIILIIVISSNLFSDVSTSICTNSHESLTGSWIQIHLKYTRVICILRIHLVNTESTCTSLSIQGSLLIL